MRNEVIVVVEVLRDRKELPDRQERPAYPDPLERMVHQGVLALRVLLALKVQLVPRALQGAWRVTGGNVFGSIRTLKLIMAFSW